MSHQSVKDLVAILECEPALRSELERAGVQSESQLTSVFQALGARVGVPIGAQDVQLLLGSVNALQRESAELADDELERVSGGGGGDDAQLANVDLQNILQKQQQTLRMMSNISKMLNDTARSVIRKIGG